jgi:pimeloyl-ACP methyl ester carboxylesterase
VKIIRGGARAGRRLLWIHGYTLDSSVFGPIWEALPQYDHIAFDLPGHGATPFPAEGDLFKASVEALRRVLDECDVRDVVAMSYGGGIVLSLLAEEPDRLDSVVLAAPALPGGPRDQQSSDCHLELIWMARERGLGPWLAERWLSCPPRIFAGLARSPDLAADISAIVARHSFRELLDARPTIASDRIDEAQLRKIGCRALIIAGEDDMESFRRTAALLKRNIAGSDLRWLANVGHLPLIEAPALCAREISSWLPSTGRAPGTPVRP